MRYMWAVLLALVALLGVSVANAAIPVWENGVMTEVMIQEGDSCWRAYKTMQKHGVDVAWNQVLVTEGCKTLVQPGDTIKVPAQPDTRATWFPAPDADPEFGTSHATKSEQTTKGKSDDATSTDATTTPVTVDGAGVVADTTKIEKAPATTGMDVNTRITAAQTMHATVEFRPVPQARPKNLIRSKPATPKKNRGVEVGKATVETGSTRAMAPKECDDVCEANLAVLARINTTMVETGPAEAGHVAPKDGTGMTTYHDPWRAVLAGCDNSIGCVEIRKQCEQALEPASRVRCYHALVAERDRILPYLNLTGFPELEEIARNDALAQLAQLKDSKEIDLDEDFAGVEERHDS